MTNEEMFSNSSKIQGFFPKICRKYSTPSKTRDQTAVGLISITGLARELNITLNQAEK